MTHPLTLTLCPRQFQINAPGRSHRAYVTSWEDSWDSQLSNGGFRLKIGQLLKESWVFLWKGSFPGLWNYEGVRLLRRIRYITWNGKLFDCLFWFLFQTCLTLPQSVGFVGGKPNHAHYFIGFVGKRAIGGSHFFVRPHQCCFAFDNNNWLIDH